MSITTTNDDGTPHVSGGPFGVRLDAATLARMDAYAARIGRKRGGAAAVAIAAGLDALEGIEASAPVSVGIAVNGPTVGQIATAVVEEMLAQMSTAAWAKAVADSDDGGDHARG